MFLLVSLILYDNFRIGDRFFSFGKSKCWRVEHNTKILCLSRISWPIYMPHARSPALKSEKAVSAYLKSKQILPFGSLGQPSALTLTRIYDDQGNGGHLPFGAKKNGVFANP